MSNTEGSWWSAEWPKVPRPVCTGMEIEDNSKNIGVSGATLLKTTRNGKGPRKADTEDGP